MNKQTLSEQGGGGLPQLINFILNLPDPRTLEMDSTHRQIDHKKSYLSTYLHAGCLNVNVWDLGLAIHGS